MTLIDFQQIRFDNNLEAVVERYLGPSKNGKWCCPFHNDKTPSFSVKGGRYKCFGACGASGDVIDFVAAMEKLNLKDAARKLGGYLLDLGLSPEQVKAKQAEIRAENARRETQRKADERAKREEALNRVAGMVSRVEQYHGQVEAARDYWLSQGLTDTTIKRFKLGCCPKFPVWEKVEGEYRIAEYVQSYSIPYYQNGQLINIRHRLAGREKNKYRPEFAGLGNQLFNVDAIQVAVEEIPLYLEQGEVLLVEGEIKAMYLNDCQMLPAVGMPGQESWQDEWIKYFAGASKVYVALDPDAERKAKDITRTFNANGINAYQVACTCKPDDFFWHYGGSLYDFLRILDQGRRVT